MTALVVQLPMVPSQPSTKRKAQDDNPLLNAAKKAKLEAKGGASNKRKLLNAEEQPGGLRIVRTPSVAPRLASEPPNSNPPRPPSSQSQRPISSADAGPSRQPSKKFRSGSQPPTSRTKSGSRSHERDVTPSTQEDLEIEKDVRAMEDEVDHLRRNSRAHTTIDASFMLSANPAFQFPPRSPDSDTPRKGKSRIIDTSVPLSSEETPQIERNKLLREGAMAAISNGRSREQVQSNGAAGRHRRKSSASSRGKRISSSFEATGVITQPHGSVTESSFYKHIDCDLPDAERVRQLLIWCASRASYGASNTPSKSRSAPQPEPEPQEPLPPLSAEDVLLLKKEQEAVIRMLAERKIDLSLYTPEASGSGSGIQETLKENDQNVTNRNWEITYGNDIQRAVEEDEAWKKVGYVYDTYMKKGRTELEQRLSVSQQRKETLTPSEKAKGKQRATELDWGPREHELPESFRHGVGLANSVLGIRAVGDQRIAGSSSRRRVTIGTGMGNEEMEAELERRILEMEFKADHLYALASTARTSLDVIERTLDQRFEQLNLHLTARSGLPRPVHDPGSGSGAQILSTYVKQDPGMTGPDAMDVMRALARVDMERPPAMVGDEARRAVREVQRAGESGIGAVGDRRLTGLPPSSGLTPRKVPGTPRRGSTPGRERER